jgi:hypothetical protein
MLTGFTWLTLGTSNELIRSLRRKLDENCSLLGYYAASSGNSLQTFQDNLSGPIFKGQESWTLKTGPIGWPETSVSNYNYTLRNWPEDSSSQIMSSSGHKRKFRVSYRVRFDA